MNYDIRPVLLSDPWFGGGFLGVGGCAGAHTYHGPVESSPPYKCHQSLSNRRRRCHALDRLNGVLAAAAVLSFHSKPTSIEPGLIKDEEFGKNTR